MVTSSLSPILETLPSPTISEVKEHSIPTVSCGESNLEFEPLSLGSFKRKLANDLLKIPLTSYHYS